MIFTRKSSCRLFLVPVVLGLFAGCQQQGTANTPKKTGTYTAARHSQVGSNIPQRESVDATGATYDPDRFQNDQQTMSNMSRSTLGGTGTR